MKFTVCWFLDVYTKIRRIFNNLVNLKKIRSIWRFKWVKKIDVLLGMVRGTWDGMGADHVQQHCHSAVWPHFNGPVLSCPSGPLSYQQPVTSHSSLHGWNNGTASSATCLPWYVTFTARINPQNSWAVSYILCHMKYDLYCGSIGWFHHFVPHLASILICSSQTNY